MKKKLLLILLAVTVSVATIAAATMAWFTDEATAGTATFKAGTVKVKVDGPTYEIEGKDIENVNPGDEFRFGWTIENEGSKRMVFKVDVDAYYTGLRANEFKENIFKDNGYDNSIVMKNLMIGFVDENDEDNGEDEKVYYFVQHGTAELLETPNWTIVYTGPDVEDPQDYKYYKDFNNFTIYYTGDPKEEGETVTLTLVLTFLGEETHNGYQGAHFYLGGTVTAVQATNGAPAAELDDVVYADYNY